MARPKLTDIERQRRIIRKTLSKLYACTSQQAENKFIDEWVKTIIDNGFDAKDISLILKYLWENPVKIKEKEEEKEEKNFNIILPDYDLKFRPKD